MSNPLEKIDIENITATPISYNDRINTLPYHFPKSYIIFEQAVFNFASEASTDYASGFWEFFELSNGGFFMCPSGGKFTVKPDGIETSISAVALGAYATTIAYSHLSFAFNARNQSQACAEMCKGYELIYPFVMNLPDRADAAAVIRLLD